MEKIGIEPISLVFQTNALTNSAIFPEYNHHSAESRRIELHSLVNQLLSRQYPAQQELLSVIVGKVRIEHTRPKQRFYRPPRFHLRTIFPYYIVSTIGFERQRPTANTKLFLKQFSVPIGVHAHLIFCGGNRNRTYTTLQYYLFSRQAPRPFGLPPFCYLHGAGASSNSCNSPCVLC